MKSKRRIEVTDIGSGYSLDGLYSDPAPAPIIAAPSPTQGRTASGEAATDDPPLAWDVAATIVYEARETKPKGKPKGKE